LGGFAERFEPERPSSPPIRIFTIYVSHRLLLTKWKTNAPKSSLSPFYKHSKRFSPNSELITPNYIGHPLFHQFFYDEPAARA